LGAEKFFDIKCRLRWVDAERGAGQRTIRALKYQAGKPLELRWPSRMWTP
jgi:formyltetrahydrofolate synthetase